MEYCKYCNETREKIELRGECVCEGSHDGAHSYTTRGYEAGYAFGEYVIDRIIAIFRSLFNRK